MARTAGLLSRNWRPAAPGLLDVTENDIRDMKLAELRAVAKRAGLHPSWHAAKKSDLARELVSKRREHAAFVRAVESHGFSAAARRGAEEIKGAFKKGAKGRTVGKERGFGGDSDSSQTLLRRAMRACVHIVPSGSGVRCGPRGSYVLTCAHCVAWDGEGDDWGEESYYDPACDDEVDGTGNGNGGSRYAVGSTTQREGRMVTIVDARGVHAGAVCVYHCDKLDLALLRIVDERGRLEPKMAVGAGCFEWVGSERKFVGVAREPRPELARANTRVVCIGNPFDVDLECPEGETPRPMGFTPFWVSAGVLQGRLLTWKESAAKENLGRQRHSCWTYWGHSGAPLLRPVFHDDPDGDENSMQVEVVGIHNSWDDTNGQRHAVSLEDIQQFTEAFWKQHPAWPYEAIDGDEDSYTSDENEDDAKPIQVLQ